MRTKQFHIGDVLSVTTGHLVSPRHMKGIYEILNYLTGDNLFTHQLPRAMRECRPFVFEQHPELRDVDASSVNSENWQSWLTTQVDKFGEQIAIAPIPRAAHIRKHPIDEAVEMGAKNVIATDGSADSVNALVREIRK